MSNITKLKLKIFDWLSSCNYVQDYEIGKEFDIYQYVNSYDYSVVEVVCDDYLIEWARVVISQEDCDWYDSEILDWYVKSIEDNTASKFTKVTICWFEALLEDKEILEPIEVKWWMRTAINELIIWMNDCWDDWSFISSFNTDIIISYDRWTSIYSILNEIAEQTELYRRVSLVKSPLWVISKVITFKDCIWKDRTQSNNDYFSVEYDHKNRGTNTVSSIKVYTKVSKVSAVLWRDSQWDTTKKLSSWDIFWIKYKLFDSALSFWELRLATWEELERTKNNSTIITAWVDKNIDAWLWDKIVVKINNWKNKYNGNYIVTVVENKITYKNLTRFNRVTLSNSSVTYINRSTLINNLFKNS